MWDVDIDNADVDMVISNTGGDDPWDFGTSYQYPVLKYGDLDVEMQRPTVTLSLDPSSISETDGETTLTATQDRTANLATTLTISASPDTAVNLSSTSLTIDAGSMTGSIKIKAVDNSATAAAAMVTVSASVSPGGSGANPVDDDVTLTITDDESLEPDLVENVRVRTKETLAVVTWDALDGARRLHRRMDFECLARRAQLEPLQLPGSGRHIDHRPAAGPR